MLEKPLLAEEVAQRLEEEVAQRVQRLPVRNDLIDVAKGVLICCVVLYHTAVVYTSADRPEVCTSLCHEPNRF